MRIEEHVHLCVRAAFRLWHTEVSPNNAQSANACPKESCLGTPVPCARIEHVRRKNVGDNTCDVVEVARKHDGLVAQVGGRDLSDERVATIRSGSATFVLEDGKKLTRLDPQSCRTRTCR